MLCGLSETEVASQKELGLINVTKNKTSRSLGDIFRANIFTRFNALLTVLFVVVMFVGQPLDALFFMAVIVNSGVGIIQEIRAKRTLDRLTILNSPKVTVVRNSRESLVDSEDIVQGDLIKISAGDQVPTDGSVIRSDGMEIDESLLTGEVDPVSKNFEDKLLSGSIVMAGGGLYCATDVGENAYAAKLAAQVKKFTKTKSELLEGTNRLLGYISLVILIVTPLLLWGQLSRSGSNFTEAMTRSVAAIVGMIPEGLVVLTSFAFVLAALALARRKVLVQELPAVEGLARVDVICLDKTGTLTEGGISFHSLEIVEPKSEAEAREALAVFATNPNSATLKALNDEFPVTTQQASASVPFSSKRKWSSVSVGRTNWVMGAPEILLPSSQQNILDQSESLSAKGYRVMVLSKTTSQVTEKSTPTKLDPVALVVLAEKVRDDAAETLNFFAEQGVQLKVISGDNPRTVAAIASQVGIDASKVFDARQLPSDPQEMAKIIDSYNVFGRVMPEQKRLFVKALQSAGHVVAMTGDGVNDALALKDADLGVAMGNGAPATKAIAQIVLLDNKFSHMPYVLGEGRRVIANIERVANLFIIKNVYNLVLILAVTVMALSFPFLPRHLTVISWLTIGIPAFFLALAPNNRRYRPGFLPRVLRFAIPVGVLVSMTALLSYALALNGNSDIRVASTAAVISVVTIGVWVLVCLARPLRAWKVGLITTLAGLFIVAVTWSWFAEIFEFRLVWPYAFYGLVSGVVASIVVEWFWRNNARSFKQEP